MYCFLTAIFTLSTITRIRFLRLFPYNVCIDFNDFRSKIMNQYEKEIQALKYRCWKLEQQCSMFDDTFQKQNQLVKSQNDMIQILKERMKKK